MKPRRLVQACALLMVAASLNGCIATDRGYTYGYGVDPHYKQENQAAMRAVGTIIRPFSQVGPTETQQRLQGLEALGTLMDLSNR